MAISDGIASSCLRARLWMGRKRFGLLGRAMVRINKTRIIKGSCEAGELEGLKFVAQHTSIPVPKVHRTYHMSGHLYIEMGYVEGDTLESAWSNGSLSADQKQVILNQFTGYVDQLRALEAPREGMAASAELGPVQDCRVGCRPFGPFKNHGEFHAFLRGGVPLGADCTEAFGEHVTRCHARGYRTRFTHADLCPRNMIVRDGKIVAVIDWQFAGWYPEYWEYTKAHYQFLKMPDWYSGIEHGMQRYDDELAVENTLWQRLDQPGAIQR